MEHWILLRGLVREAAHWHDFPERFERALPGTRAHTVDIPGNGAHFQSPTPPSVDGMMEAIRAESLERTGAAQVRVLAVSLGGMIAVAWADKHPHEISGLVLANTSLGGVSPFWQRLRPSAWPKLVRANTRRDMEARERGVLGVISNRTDLHDATARSWAEIQRARPVSRGNALRQLTAAARFRVPEKPPAAPTLILVGDGDRLVDPACSRAIAARFGAPLAAHPSAGHDISLDAGDWVLDEITRWRAGLR